VPLVQWIGVAFFALLGLLAVRPTIRLWQNNEPRNWRSKPLWLRRSIPTIVGVAWAMLVGAVATPAATSRGGVVGALFTVIVVSALVTVVVGAALWGAVASLGSPRWLVPPHLREGATGSMSSGRYFKRR
jgi:hypothetical protein